MLSSVAAEKHVAWHPLKVTFTGPIAASETEDGPNPFLDYRLQVQFTGPSGQTYDIPGYFDGDGKGGDTGNLWQAKFRPDEAEGDFQARWFNPRNGHFAGAKKRIAAGVWIEPGLPPPESDQVWVLLLKAAGD